MRIILTVLVGLLIFSCNTTTEKKANDTKAELETETPVEKPNSESTEFQFSDFKIMNSRLGSIEVGMTIQEAEKQFDGLTKKVDEAVNFGFGGGSPAYLYYSGDEILFGLIPSLGTDTLLFIIAAHKNLQTTNGLSPNSTVKDLLEKYPDLMVNQDLMNSWEYFQDTTNGWDFVFMTDEQTEIGEYPDLENPSKPKRLTKKTDWITIR
ncbi:hypothetical protein [Yeosuana sp. AK3]